MALVDVNSFSRGGQCESTSGPNDVVVVGDICLHNRVELVRELQGIEQDELSLASDAVLVAHAYRQFGCRCFGMLLGEFAVVIWDGRRQTILAVRDAVGQRALFFQVREHEVLVGDSLATLQEESRPQELGWDLTAVAAYLAGTRMPATSTVHAAWRRLPAGNWLEVPLAGPERIECYWSPRNTPSARFATAQESAEEFGRLFQEAIRCRLPPPGSTVGLHLSGGLDSAAVTAAVCDWHERLGRPWKGTAVINQADDPAADERRYVSEFLHTWPLEQIVTRAEDHWGFREETELATRNCTAEEPFRSPYHSRLLAELAALQQRGATSLWTGDGGDEIGGTSLYLVARLLGGRWRGLRGELLVRAAGKRSSPRGLVWRLLRETVRRMWYPGRVRLHAPAWLSPPLTALTREMQTAGAKTASRFAPLRESMLEQLESAVDEPLWAQSASVARNFAITLQRPLLDRRLLEWACQTPLSWMGEAGCLKAPCRRAWQKLVPSAILGRTDKGNYRAYFDLGLRDRERARIQRWLDEPRCADLGWVQVAPLRQAYARYCAGGPLDVGPFWNWLTLERWLRM